MRFSCFCVNLMFENRMVVFDSVLSAYWNVIFIILKLMGFVNVHIILFKIFNYLL